MASFEAKQRQTQKQEQLILANSSLASLDSTESNCDKPVPPKDFLCPITSTVFVDPVTIETGQTYERKAIKEWLGRGNSTCPITRQKLQNTQLPKTNYVLKRLIGIWKKEHNPESPLPKSDDEEEEAPNVIPKLGRAISTLCASDDLRYAESAILRVERLWRKVGPPVENDIVVMLSNPATINGLIETLSNSADPKVLGAAIYLLVELGSRDRSVIQTLTRVESNVEAVAFLFKKGFVDAVVLIYLVRESASAGVAGLDLVGPLLQLIKTAAAGGPVGPTMRTFVRPETAAMVVLCQILEEENGTGRAARAMVVSRKAVESVVWFLGSSSALERNAAVGILIKCLREDGKCKDEIADTAELGPLLDSFVGSGDKERFDIVCFLSELVKFNRRTLNEKILQRIKDEGSVSTMHNLVVYLQTACEDRMPLVAGLLLQLDLLIEPREMSIFREEAIDSLVACIRNSNSPGVRVAAAETIVSLQGRFTRSGKPLARPHLLKRAGLRKTYDSLVRIDRLTSFSDEDDDSFTCLDALKEEEKAAEKWERKMAYVLAGHEFGVLFEALSEGMKSGVSDLGSPCFVAATWLVDMLKTLPDTGVRGAARVCLLECFVSVFKTSRDAEDRALSLLALNSFVQDTEGLSQLTSCLKDISRGLRELKKLSPLATEMLRIFSQTQESSAELWTHKQLVEVDCRENGEVLSVVCFKDKIFSGHSDGTIKVWTGKGSVLHPVVEIREHKKAVTSLVISPEKEIIYSGSLDRTIRVWSVSEGVFDCIQVHDVKDQVQSLVVHGNICCFIPQGSGVKVQSLNGIPKLLNSTKYVKCLALAENRLYCGCQDNSIQEINLEMGTLSTIQGGSKKLLAKASPVQALQAHGGLLYAASSSLDGTSIKVLSTSNYSTVGSLHSALEVRAMAMSSELVYLGCKKGKVEVWNIEKKNKIETLQIGVNGRVLCLALGATEEVLVIGISDGLIQAWGLT